MSKSHIGRGVAWALLVAAVVVTVFPFYWMLRTALTPTADLFSDAGSLWPHHPTLINFERVLGMTSAERARAAGGSGAQINFLAYTLNSIIYSGAIAIAQTFFCAMAGYAFARLRFPGRDLIFGVLVAALMVPPIFTLLPNFALVKNLGLINTFAGLVAPSVLMTPFAVFFLRQFFLGISREVEEAAVLDGAGRWKIFRQLIVPMSAAPLTTLAVLTYITAWNEYMWPLVVGDSDKVRVLTVALNAFKSATPQIAPPWAPLMAGTFLAAIPIIVLFMFLARRMVDAIGFSGIK
jgi:multiple sugar transport system permease protein